MKVLKCNNCKRNKYLKNEESVDKCPFCKSLYFQIYENKEQHSNEEINSLNESREIKGGAKMEKVSKTDVRIANANKVVEFACSLGCDDKEVSKILNRAYSIHRNKKA